MAERYATAAQIIGKLPEISSMTFWTASTNAKIVEQENFAAGEVDGVLYKVYSIPFSSAIASTPLGIQELTALMAALRIATIEWRKQTHNASEWVDRLRDEIYGNTEKCIQGFLSRILSGEFTLITSAGVVTARVSEMHSSTLNDDPVFGMGKNGEFESDRDQWENVKENE